jgi:RimJ/RimL family protein N-acetyltransferase
MALHSLLLRQPLPRLPHTLVCFASIEVANLQLCSGPNTGLTKAIYLCQELACQECNGCPGGRSNGSGQQRVPPYTQVLGKLSPSSCKNLLLRRVVTPLAHSRFGAQIAMKSSTTAEAGELCKLRPLQSSDAALTIAWRNDPLTRRGVLGHEFPVTEEMERGWYEAALSDQRGKNIRFAVEALDNGQLVGMTHLTAIDWIARSTEFGIVIGTSDRRGQGFGFMATRQTLAYAFNALGLNRVGLRYSTDNAPAASLYERLGFKVEGKLRQAAFLDGAHHDVVVCSLLRGEFVS